MPLWLTSAQPLHAVPNLYGSGKGWCMVAGHRTADCPVNATYDGLYWPRESVHLEETRWCSTEKAAIWEEADGDLKPVWVDQRFQGTCCHYPATAEVWEARYVKVNVYDEDNWNSNDLLGSFEVDLHVSAPSSRSRGGDGKHGERERIALLEHPLLYCGRRVFFDPTA